MCAVVQTLLFESLGLGLGLLTASVHHLDVIVEYGRDDGNHVGLYHSSPDIL
jgi:hypothetical protein